MLKLKYDKSKDEVYKGVFHHKHCRLSQFLLSKWSTINDAYKPTFWATNGHLQTLLHLFWPRSIIRFQREYLQVEDQGVVALDWITETVECSHNITLNSASPILLVIPALTCGVREISTICRKAQEYSFRCVVYNRRGQAGSVLTTACLQNACHSKELDEILTYLHSTYPYAKIVAVAYSSGASLLLYYLEETRKTPLCGAVCISPSYETEKSFEQCLPPFYDYLMTKRLTCFLREHPGLANFIDMETALKCKNMREFNQRVFEPLTRLNCSRYGYESQLNSHFNNISRVRVPILCISALDDPICNADIIPYSSFKNSSNFFLLTCEKGGHCGFYQGYAAACSWADQQACSFLEIIVNFSMRKNVESICVPSIFAQVRRDRSYTQ